MMPFLPLARRVAAPCLFLLALGGIMALAEYWIWCQLPRPPAVERSPATARYIRRVPVVRRDGTRRASTGRPA